jgi:hypothetical protein
MHASVERLEADLTTLRVPRRRQKP